MKYNTSNAGPNTQAAYRNVRLKPRMIARVPVIIPAPFNPTFAIPVKIPYCVAPILGFVTSMNNAHDTVE